MSRYIVGVTGASGSIYGVRFVEELLKQGNEVLLILTDNGRTVLKYEMDCSLEDLFCRFRKLGGVLKVYDNHDIFAPVASGSFQVDGMIIIPCSMGTLAKIASGISDNLLGRAADVCLKEKRNFVIVPRETPLNSIHLKNMLHLSEMGVTILPPMPSFYQKPKSLEELIDITIGRVLSCLNISNTLYKEWNGGF